jgi:cell division protein DivIC
MEDSRERQERARSRRARRRKQKSRYKQNRAGMLCISGIVLFLLVAMSVQILRLHETNEEYKAQERELSAQLESEQERREAIQAYEEYVTTPEYIEEIAKTKLGLIYPNEIIFKEK